MFSEKMHSQGYSTILSRNSRPISRSRFFLGSTLVPSSTKRISRRGQNQNLLNEVQELLAETQDGQMLSVNHLLEAQRQESISHGCSQDSIFSVTPDEKGSDCRCWGARAHHRSWRKDHQVNHCSHRSSMLSTVKIRALKSLSPCPWSRRKARPCRQSHEMTARLWTARPCIMRSVRKTRHCQLERRMKRREAGLDKIASNRGKVFEHHSDDDGPYFRSIADKTQHYHHQIVCHSYCPWVPSSSCTKM